MRWMILAAVALIVQTSSALAGPFQPVQTGPDGHLVPVPARHWEDPTHSMLLGVARAGQRLVAVGELGIVLLSDDGGKTFRQAKSVPVSSTLTAVNFVDADHGWAVGQWGVIIATMDGGESWQLQRVDTPVDQPLFSVMFRNQNDGFAVGLWSLFLKTADGGRNWTPIKLPPPPGSKRADRNLMKIFGDPKGALYVAGEQGTVLRSTDQGATWRYLASGYKGTFWTGVAAADGSLFVAGLRGNLYRSLDGGDTWASVPSGATDSITGLADIGGMIVGVGLEGNVVTGETTGSKLNDQLRPDKKDLTGVIGGEAGRLIFTSTDGILGGAMPVGPVQTSRHAE